MDIPPHRRDEFFIDRPLEVLKADHQLIRQLFDRYFRAKDANEKKDIGPHILLLLEMHTSLEEGIFYSRVREADPALVDQCQHEHDEAGQMIAKLKIMDEGDPQTEQTFHQLADTIFKHIETEEHQLFPKVLQARLDLGAIGQEMRAFEAGLLGARAHRPSTPDMRQ